MFYRRVPLVALALLALAACAPEPTLTPTARALAVPTPTDLPQSATPTLNPAQPRTPLPVTTSTGTNPLNGKFVFAPGDGSIWTMDVATGHAQILVKASANQFADSPALTPDGSQVVYTLQELSPQGSARTSVYLIDTNGANPHILSKPPDAKTSFYWPAVSPDGKWVYYTSSFPVPPNQEHTALERVSLAGGASQTLFENAQRVAPAPDGKQLAFLRFNYTTYASSLWLADSDGQHSHEIMPDTVFAAIGTPSFSPDGQWLLLAASGPPSHPLPGALVPRGCEPQLLCRLVAPVYADGLPWDLWLVKVDGKQFRQLTQVGADSPSPAWSRDGTRVAFMDTNGIYLVDVQTRAISLLSKNGGHGTLGWWQPPN